MKLLQGITYFLSGVYLFIVGQEFIKSVGNLIQESQHNNTNPLLYLHLVETTTYINLIATVTIIQSSGGTSLLKFVNKVDRISQSTRLCQSGVVTKANFYIYLCVCSTLSVCNYFIFNNFGKIEISGLLQEAYQANSLWIYEINTTVLTNRTDSAKNVFFAGCHLTAIIVRNLRDTYVDLYFLSGIITLWSISKDFKTKSWPIQRHRGSNQLWRQCCLFRKISALSRSHSVAFGYGLCSYMVYQVTYYSLHLDNVFAVKAGLGQRFYYFEFMLAFGLVFVCGAHHLHQVLRFALYLLSFGMIKVYDLILDGVTKKYNFPRSFIPEPECKSILFN